MAQPDKKSLGSHRETTFVFLSYSRSDSPFADKLFATLEARGFDVFQDKHDILSSKSWRDRLLDLISKADAVVFVITPDSIGSKTCNWELEQAIRLNKRMIPILAEPTDFAAIPFRLTELNYIFFTDTGTYENSAEQLITALNTDIDWVRDHTRLGDLARRWDKLRRRRTMLLWGHDLREARAWLIKRPPEAPEPDELLKTFILDSRDAQTRRRQKYAALSLLGVLATAAVPVGLFPGQSYVAAMRLPAAYYINQNSEALPLSAAARENIKATFANLIPGLQLTALNGIRGSDAKINPWSMAQSTLAILDFAKADPAQVQTYFTDTMDRDCGCWRELKDRQPHAGSTGWVLVSMAQQGVPAPKEAIEFIIQLQDAQGWWALHPATSDPQNAATYATAWALLALNVQKVRTDDADLKAKIESAIAKGRDWLLNAREPGKPFWKDYPANTDGRVSIGVSGLALHVLHQMAPPDTLAEIDRLWLEAMPIDIADPDETELTNTTMLLKSGTIEFDRTRNYRLQWAMIATADAYAAGTNWQKARAAAWMEFVLRRNLATDAVLKQPWVAAELVVALRHLQQRLP